jgi:hypothetical protein
MCERCDDEYIYNGSVANCHFCYRTWKYKSRFNSCLFCDNHYSIYRRYVNKYGHDHNMMSKINQIIRNR